MRNDSTTRESTPAALALAADLRRRVRGEVGFGPADRALYAQDASHYRQVPIGVVVPESIDDVEAAVAVCREHDAPVLPRGAGTSLAGQTCNVAVVIDFSRHLNRILAVDPEVRRARVEPGVIVDALRAAAELHGLTFGPDPSTHASCTLGGMIANNACGVHSVMAGRTSDNVEELDVLTWEGEHIRLGAGETALRGGRRQAEMLHALRALRDDYAEQVRARYPRIPRRVSGYNLDELLEENGFHVARSLVGSEGTCALTLEATVRLVPSPAHRVLVVLGFAGVSEAADHAPEVLAHGPIGLEGTGDFLIDNMRAKGLEARGTALLPPGRGWLLVELGGDSHAEAVAAAERLRDSMGSGPGAPTRVLVEDPADIRAVWSSRESAVGASARLADGTETWAGWEDAAVPPERLGAYLRDFERLTAERGFRTAIYGHFGQGCVHARIDFDLRSHEGVSRYRSFVEAATDLVVSYGGSLSGEHGDGKARSELLPKMFGPELLDAFARFRAVWDPAGRMNPGILVDPAPLDHNLRYGGDYRRPEIDTHFRFPDDEGSFAHAAARCIGVGKCRRESGGTMCPSFMATREERHTTRGRARLLAEMLDGTLPGGWRDESLRDALDLCLACKGCKRDCPAGVDVATYKAEFLSHYYEGRRRPRHAWAFGLIDRWARIASIAPTLVNAVAAAPLLSAVAKRLAGIAPGRSIPCFAARSFQRRITGRPSSDPTRPRVVLWPDTFNNYFHPEVAEAALVVLEEAGFGVIVPSGPVCCGRPLYDLGMLDRARRSLERTLTTLCPWIEEGLPVVGLEPSCIAVFRDELGNLFPDDPLARRLRGLSFTLAGFLRREAPGYRPYRVSGRALFHAHCHQKALFGAEDDLSLLRETGLEVATPDTGCCGMAGSFGFEPNHYELSLRIGERVLLPAVRASPPDTRIVTDGFSCREQIVQATGRPVMHIAQVLAGR